MRGDDLAVHALVDGGRFLAKTAVSRLYRRSPGRPEAAANARDAWFGLARATHHHAYELAATAAELRSWHDPVSKISKTIGEGSLGATAGPATTPQR